MSSDGHRQNTTSSSTHELKSYDCSQHGYVKKQEHHRHPASWRRNRAKAIAVKHDRLGFQQLIQTLREVGEEKQIVMEHTGMYGRPIAIASVLQQEGFFVSVVNAILTHQFSDNSLRKVKTDKADSLKLANDALTYWSELKR